MQERQHFLAHGTFCRPHAHRRFAKDLSMLLDCPPHLHDRIVRIAAGVARQLEVRQRLAGQLFVQEQRQNGMIEGRRGQLDLSGLGQFAMERNHLSKDVQLFGQEPVFFVLRESAALVAQAAQVRVALEYQRMDPGQVKPDLQIAKVALLKTAERLAATIPHNADTAESCSRDWP